MMSLKEMETLLAEEKSYEQRQQLKWKNYKRNWNLMTDEQRCDIVWELQHTSYTWVPKAFIWTVFDWFLTELEYERIEVYSACVARRDRFKLIKPEERQGDNHGN